MLRLIDVVLAIIGLIVFLPIFMVIYIIGLFDTGSPLFIQQRVGKNRLPFNLIKFRSMRIGAKQVGTHFAKNSDITQLGSFLRKSKLDEIPQLINVIKGDMSLVGPRPGLPSQTILMTEREKRGIFKQKPGITGLGQINEIDMSTPKKLSKYDKVMLDRLDLCLYCKILLATAMGKGKGDRVKQKT